VNNNKTNQFILLENLNMKRLMTICSVILMVTSLASAADITWNAWSVHDGEYTISQDGSSMTFAAQPHSSYHWYLNGVEYPAKDGMKTFGTTGYFDGANVSALTKMQFNYTIDSLTSPSINIYAYDTGGKHAILGITALNAPDVSTDIGGGLRSYTYNFGSWADTVSVKLYENTGLLEGATTATWGQIKNLKIGQGGYTGQQSPEGDWAAWSSNYTDGIALIWGDTAASAPRDKHPITVSNLVLNDTLTANFVPEPATLGLLTLGGLGLLRRRKA
jgi:hypothetical protein